jgi:hypothetical protein
MLREQLEPMPPLLASEAQYKAPMLFTYQLAALLTRTTSYMTGDRQPTLQWHTPPVLNIQVVGVLPDIHSEDWSLALHYRGDRVRGLLNGELPRLVSHQPGPP